MLSGMRRRAVRALDRVERWLEPEVAQTATSTPAANSASWNAPTRAEVSARSVPTPTPAPAPTAKVEPVQAKPVEAPKPVQTKAVEAPMAVEPAPAKAVEAPSTPVEAPAEATDAPAEASGAPIELAVLEQVLDDLVRPALQSDGGDITVVKIDNNDIYVRLIGACSTCPSSIMTLRMGVERLLREEFPAMGELIQVDDVI